MLLSWTDKSTRSLSDILLAVTRMVGPTEVVEQNVVIELVSIKVVLLAVSHTHTHIYIDIYYLYFFYKSNEMTCLPLFNIIKYKKMQNLIYIGNKLNL